MTAPEDPYAPPPQGSRPVPYGDRRPWPPPSGAPRPGPSGTAPGGSTPGSAALGVAALVVGLLATVTGVTIVTGLVLGPTAIALGLSSRARARAGGAGVGGPAVAGIVLGVIGLLVAGGTWLYVRPAYQQYQDCRKESVSAAQDRACETQLRQRLAHTS